MRQVEFGIGRKFLLITLITSFDRFVTHLNMFINCPNALLQVGFIQSLVCCDLTLKFLTCTSAMLVVRYKRIFYQFYCGHQPWWASYILSSNSREIGCKSRICQPLLVNVYGVKSADWTVYTLNLPISDARKKLVFMLIIQQYF